MGVGESKFCCGFFFFFFEDVPLKYFYYVYRSVTVNVSQFSEGTMKAGKSHKYMVSMMNV